MGLLPDHGLAAHGLADGLADHYTWSGTGLAASSGLAVHYTWISVMYSEIPNLSTYGWRRLVIISVVILVWVSAFK